MKSENALPTEQIIEAFETYRFSASLSMQEICDTLCMTEDELLAIPEINRMMSL